MSSPASAMPPPGVDPAEWLKIQRQSQIADFLQQDALTAPTVQQPAGGGKFYQAARVSPFQGLAKLAEALLARKTTDTANAGRSKILAAQLAAYDPNGGGPSPQSPVSAAAAPPPPGGSLGGFSGGPGASDAGQPGSAQPANAGPAVNPNNPFHLPARIAMDLAINHPDKFAELAAGTPEYRTMLAAFGGDQTKAMEAMRQKAVKDSTITMRSGEEALIPQAGGGYQSVRTPNLPAGLDYSRDPRTQELNGAHPIPGVLDYEGALAGAQTGAREQNTPRMIPMGGGVERFAYPQDAGAGLPPALRAPSTPQLPSLGQGGPAPGAPPKNYFPPAPAAPAAQTSAPPAGPKIPVKDPETGTFENNLWANIPQVSVPKSPGQTSNDYQQKILDKLAEKHQELVNHYGEQAALATQSNAFYQQALKELPQAETGPMSHWLTENRSRLLELAPSLKDVLPGSGTITPTLELNKALVNAGLQGAKANFGRITQGEVMMQKDEMSPSAKMTHDAIAALIHQQQIRNGYAIQQNKDYNDYHAANGDPNSFEAQYNVYRPLTRFAAQYDTPQAALDRLKTHPELLPDFNKKFGWDPSR